MLNEVMDKFIELVRQGKIDGCGYDEDKGLHTDQITWIDPDSLLYTRDHLCAHIRRWLSGKGLIWDLVSVGLTLRLTTGGLHFTQGSELDWHLEAAIWVCEREG